MIKNNIFKIKIIPEKLIKQSTLHMINVHDSNYHINEFDIITKNNKINNIKILKGSHPNCDPVTKEFCVPDFLKTLDLNNESLNIVIEMLKTFNFESSYYHPWGSFNYKK